MANFKINLTNEQEGKIAAYCAENNIELNDANVYETTLETFKEKPIIYIERDQHTGEEVEHNVTPRIARYIECQPRTIERIVAKVDLYKRKLQTNLYECNIAKAKIDTHPDINKLVENLYRLNIVDGNSYLGLVCFLMQLKYSRDAEIREDDKSCVFFNGVARNGKSATAKAICEIEAQYGKVFKVQSGKVLESTHEEQVWTSHLNFFDEVKPTDVDRELLLTIVNGGNVEINPKNKKHYNYYVNTNNIFTSNDQINLKQRRVSVIKFGNRLNGRPLEGGTLSKIITNIMNSLPDFEHYYNIYNIVSIYNENRVNPLAVESIITFMSSKMGFVNETEGRTLTAEITFAPHDIYNCIKNAYNKQIITSERQEAIRTVLNMFAEKKLIEEVKYEKCTTTNYRVTGENYLKIVNEYQKINTKYEQNVKITKNGLYDILSPFFTNAISTNEDDKSQKPILIEGKDLCNAHESLIKFVDDSVYNTLHSTKTYKISVSDNVRQKGTQLFYILLKHLKTLKFIKYYYFINIKIRFFKKYKK